MCRLSVNFVNQNKLWHVENIFKISDCVLVFCLSGNALSSPNLPNGRLVACSVKLRGGLCHGN